jgi:hypothetical protein
MPELCRFHGIILRMYMEVGAPRHTPHFHAYYQDDVAVYGIDPVELIAGSLPAGSNGSWKPGRSSMREN